MTFWPSDSFAQSQHAALVDGEVVNYATIARDRARLRRLPADGARVLRHFGRHPAGPMAALVPQASEASRHSGFEILADVGVVNVLAERSQLGPAGELFGKAFENRVHHELRAYLAYVRPELRLSYWRLARRLKDGIRVLPASVFVEELWTGKLL